MQQLKALRLHVQVLPLGAVLSALPVDLAIGKLLIFSTLFGLEDELMTIAAGLSIQSPFVRVDAGSSEATNRQQLVSEEGDPFTLLNVYDEWIRVKAARDNTKKWCPHPSLFPPYPHTTTYVCICVLVSSYLYIYVCV
jgi:HrpA-like RNA helicase